MFLGCGDCGLAGGADVLGVGEVATAGAAIGVPLLDLVSKWWGGESSKEVVARQLKQQKQAFQQQAALQMQQLQAQTQQLSEMERLKAEQAAYDAAMKKRSQQLTAMYAIGGVALVVAGFFVVKAMGKKA